MDVVDQKGMSEVYNACFDGDAPRVRALLKQGADVNAVLEGRFTALAIAADLGHDELMTLLLDAKANADQLAGSAQHSPLGIACSVGNVRCARLLIEARATLDLKDKDRGEMRISVEG